MPHCSMPEEQFTEGTLPSLDLDLGTGCTSRINHVTTCSSKRGTSARRIDNVMIGKRDEFGHDLHDMT